MGAPDFRAVGAEASLRTQKKTSPVKPEYVGGFVYPLSEVLGSGDVAVPYLSVSLRLNEIDLGVSATQVSSAFVVLRQIGVAVYVLHVVEVFERFDQGHQLPDIVAADGHRVAGNPA